TCGKLSLEAHQEDGTWSGPVNLRADHPQLAFHATNVLTWKPHISLHIQQFDLQAAPIRIAADFVLTDTFVGGASVQISDLTPFSELASLDLAGQVGGSIQLQGNEAACVALGKNLKIGSFLSDRADLHF